ncbi:DUF6518 family protein [Streptomyces diastatochromogenes]|uniref:DUF6518 family protein n=1 Tax=Streptomyces diastatochromogenes TaxID=42236 RepID=UPI002F26C49E
MLPALLPVGLPLVGGLIVGVSGPLLESAGNPVSHVASIVLVAGSMYALLAFGAGWVARSTRRAALTAWGVLVVAVVSYYVTKAILGDFRVPDFNAPANGAVAFGWNEFLSMIAVWCAFATVLGPVCGLAGYFSRAGSCPLRPFQRLPFQLLIPAVVSVETTMRLTYEASGPDRAVVGPVWTVARLLSIALAFLFIAIAVVRTWRSRPTAASSAAPPPN